MEPPTVGGFTYAKGTAISSAFPLKTQCAYNMFRKGIEQIILSFKYIL